MSVHFSDENMMKSHVSLKNKSALFLSYVHGRMGNIDSAESLRGDVDKIKLNLN